MKDIIFHKRSSKNVQFRRFQRDLYNLCKMCGSVCTERFIQLFGLLQRKIIDIFKVKNEHFIYDAITIFTEGMFIGTSVFFDYSLVLCFPLGGD